MSRQRAIEVSSQHGEPKLHLRRGGIERDSSPKIRPDAKESSPPARLKIYYGLLTGLEIDEALESGVAHGALAMTTLGRHIDDDARISQAAGCWSECPRPEIALQ